MSRRPSPWRALAAAGALALALALGACGGDDGDSASTTTTAKAKKSKSKKVNLPAFPAGARYFSDASPWNTPIDTVPIDSRSNSMIDLAKRRIGVIEQPGREPRRVSRLIRAGVALNTVSWAPVIVEVNRQNGTETKLLCRQVDCGPGIQVPKSLPLPTGAQPDPRYDGWMSIIDRPNGIGYDLWRARRQDNGTITFQFSKAWALNGPGFSRPVSIAPERAVGARGSGLPLFAGVVEPNELQTGQIDHALAMSVPGLARRRYVQPASVTDGIGPVRALPAGARLRLKANVRPNPKVVKGAKRRYAEAIVAALRRYGAIIVDRAAVPTLYGQYGTLGQYVVGDELDWLRLDDFEVISLPTLRLDPPSGRNAARAETIPRPATRGGF